VGYHFYRDTLGLKNGMIYFYDVTSYSCWTDGEGFYREVAPPPHAFESEGVYPRADAVSGDQWRRELAVVPNPYRGGAAWDLHSCAWDPLGTHIDFIGLPDRECDLRIYTLAGDLVQTLRHYGQIGGQIRWNLLSRNGQEVVSGVYLYAVTCGGETALRRFTIIR